MIEAYDPGEALGTIRLDGGGAVRFGRSACSFDPVGWQPRDSGRDEARHAAVRRRRARLALVLSAY